MPEPRYDFCIAVVREFTAIGYELRGMHLIYHPDIPQGDRERRTFVLQGAFHQEICNEMSKTFVTRKRYPEVKLKNKKGEGEGFFLWGVVPMLTTDSAKVIRAIGKTIDLTELDRPVFISHWCIYQCRLNKWFSNLCKQLVAKGGAQYLICTFKQQEVSKWAL